MAFLTTVLEQPASAAIASTGKTQLCPLTLAGDHGQGRRLAPSERGGDLGRIAIRLHVKRTAVMFCFVTQEAFRA